MNLNGWVQLRRGVLDHLHEGKLSNNEMLVLLVLIMLADKGTGAGTINAPTLRYFVPELSYDAAKRVLQNLEEKRYIYRKITPFSRKVYPFWVNRYIPSVGPHKDCQIDLTKVFESKDIKDIAYINHAPDDAPQGAPEGAPDPALNYKNREITKEKRNQPSIKNRESASGSSSVVEARPSSMMTKAQHTVQVASAPPSALPSAHPSSDAVAHAAPCPSTPSNRKPEPEAQIKVEKPDLATVLKKGVEDRLLAFDAGLRWSSGGYFEDLERDGRELNSDEAYRRLLRQLELPDRAQKWDAMFNDTNRPY